MFFVIIPRWWRVGSGCHAVIRLFLRPHRRDQRSRLQLRPNRYRCADVGGIVELACFPVGHPDASVGSGHSGEITLVQSVPRRKLDEERHRRADEMGVRRFAVFPRIDVPLHDATRIVNVTAVETGTMVDVFANDREAADRGAMALAPAGDSGRSGPVFAAIQVRLLLAEIDNDRRLPGMPLRNVGGNQVADCVDRAATTESGGERQKKAESRE